MQNEFKEIKLKDYLYIKGRIGWKGLKKSEYLRKSDFKIINGEALKEEIDWEKCGYISKERFEESPEIMLKEEDILISKDGTIGKVGYITELQDLATIASGIFLIRNENKKIINTKFLYYYFKSNEFKKIVESRIEGSVIPHLYQKDFEKIEFKLFDLFYQNKVVKILDFIEKKIKVNNKVNHNLENQIKLIFNRWFVEFEFPDNNGKMIKSEMGDIPYDWKIIRLRDICDISTINEKPYNNPEQTYEYFSLPAYDEGKLQKIEFGKNISSNKYMIDNDCILISKLNPTTKRIWNPLCKTINSICSTEFIVYKAKNVKLKLLCYEIINNDRFTEFLISNVTGSTGSRQRVKPQVTLNYKIPLPSTDCKIVKEFIDIAEPIHKKIQMNINENLYLTSLKNLLLPKLMNGEIDVSNIELKE